MSAAGSTPPQAITMKDSDDKPKTVQGATRMLQGTLRDARAGKTRGALSGTVEVVESIFATLLDRGEDAVAVLEQKVAERDLNITELWGKNRELEAKSATEREKKDEEIKVLREKLRFLRAHYYLESSRTLREMKQAKRENEEAGTKLQQKEAELEAAKLAAKEKRIHVVFTQPGLGTTLYTIWNATTLARMLDMYAKDTEQVATQLACTGHRPDEAHVAVPRPVDVELVPEEKKANGVFKCMAYEVRDTAPPSLERRATEIAVAGKSARLKVVTID